MSPPTAPSLHQAFLGLVDLPPADRERSLRELASRWPQLDQELRELFKLADHPSALDKIDPQQLGHLIHQALPGSVREGTQVGPFVLVRLIGIGGMGRVYLAERVDQAVQQSVAIKFVRPEQVAPALLSRFSSERQVLASLNHPGICGFIDAGQLDDGSPYVVMEHVEGTPILDYCRQHALGVAARVQLFREVLRAVDHAHQRLIVHRDIKSSNILVTPNGAPKLLDFGIAKTIAPNALQLTGTSERLFSPANAAPEQLLGGPTGAGCDIYALGALLYELLAGQGPFDFSSLRASEIEQKILHTPPLPPSQQASQGAAGSPMHPRELASDLDAIVLKCLRKRVEDRYRSVADLDADLCLLQQRRPISARRSDRLYRARLFLARHPVTTPLVASLVLLALLSAVALVRQNQELRLQRDAAVAERARAEQVVSLLEDAFHAADPTQLAGEVLSVRDVLDSAKSRITGLRHIQPEVFVRLSETLAAVELAGISESEAARLALDALQTAHEQGLGFDKTRRLHLIAARALMAQGDNNRAEQHLSVIEQAGLSNQADWWVASARLLNLKARYAEAAVTARRAIELSPKMRLSTEEVDARYELGVAKRRSDLPLEAIAEFEALLQRQLEVHPPGHPTVLGTRLEILRVRAANEGTEAVLADFDALLLPLADAYGQSSPMTGYVLATKANMLVSSNRTEESIDTFQLALDNWNRTLGASHIRTLRLGYNYALALRQIPERRTHALEYLQGVIERAESALPPGRSAVNYFRWALGNWLVEEARWEDLISMLSTPHAQQSHLDDATSNIDALFNLAGKSLQSQACTSVDFETPCSIVRQLAEDLKYRLAELKK